MRRGMVVVLAVAAALAGLAGVQSVRKEGARQALLDDGVEAAERGDLDAAEVIFRRMLAANPRDGVALANLGVMHGQRSDLAHLAGDDALSKAELEQALVAFAASLAGSPPGPPDVEVLAARAAFELGRLDEAEQRLGRVLRPKDGDNQALFYSLVTADSREQEMAQHRQLFLTEQGYPYRIELAS